MRILILGGTGFIGREVVRALSHHQLWVVHRGQTVAAIAGATTLRCDLGDLQTMRSELLALRPDVVLDMVPMSAADAKRVIDTMAGSACRIVAISSGSVYRSFGVLVGSEVGPVDNHARDESAALRRRLFPYRGAIPRPANDPKRWLDDYDKIPVEQTYQHAGGLSASIVRLPMVYGPGDPDARLAPYVRRMLDKRPVIILRRAAAAWRNSRAHVCNVAEAIACVVQHGQPGRIYNVAEPQDWSEGDWVRAIGRHLGWCGDVLEVPDDWDARARPRIDELPSTSNFAQHLRMDTRRIRSELGYREAVDPDAALRSSVLHTAMQPLPAEDDWLEDRLLQAWRASTLRPANDAAPCH